MGEQTPFAMELKESTREHHVRAERHPIQQAILQGRIDRGTWGLLVAQNRIVQEALETALDTAAKAEPRLNRVFAEHHRRLGKFDADLKALDVPPADRAPTPRTAEVAKWISALGLIEPIALIGVLYVLEGATNGGQFISRILRPALGITDGAGVSSLDPHGPQTAALWMGFRSSVNDLTLTAAERAAIVKAAGETFDALGRVFDGVVEAASTPAHSK